MVCRQQTLRSSWLTASQTCTPWKRRQQEYYQRLDAVRTQGDWEGWTMFFTMPRFTDGIAGIPFHMNQWKTV